MIKYVDKLFTETKTIILPELGALTVTNPDTKDMMFMPFLKHDDGALAAYIEKEAGISNDEARKMVSQEIHSILTALENGEKVAFGDYGYFMKDEEGDVAFEKGEIVSNPTSHEEASKPSPSELNEKEEDKTETLKEDPKKSPEESKEKDKAQEESRPTSPIAQANESKQKSTEEVSEAKASFVEKKSNQDKVSDDTNSNKATSESTSTQESKPKDESHSLRPKKEHNIAEKEEIAANRKKLEDLKKQKEAPAKRKKRGAGFWILMILIVLIVGGSTYVGINYDDMKAYIPFLAEDKAVESESDAEIAKMKEMVGDETTEPEEKPEASSDTLTVEPKEPESEDDVVATTEKESTEPVVAAKPEPSPVVTTNNNLPYHIVAGVFTNASNAERLANNIREMGYPAKTFLRGNQTVVSVKSFASSSEAQDALSTTKDAAPKGWILKWEN